jgi:hypothetical protein
MLPLVISLYYSLLQCIKLALYFIKSCVLISEYADQPWIGHFPGLVPAISQGTYVREV